MKDRRQAMSLYRTAQIAGVEADDRPLQACVLGYRSYMAGGDGDARLAVELLTQARQLVDVGASPATSAWLAGRLAEESAAIDDAGAVRAFEEGLEVYEAAVPERKGSGPDSSTGIAWSDSACQRSRVWVWRSPHSGWWMGP
jgi:hypothetical protein